MILKTPHGNSEVFSGPFDSSLPIPRHSQWGGTMSDAGERVNYSSATALPAFLRGVRLICETTAGLPICIYRGYGEQRKPMVSAPQLDMLRRPNPNMSPFAFWSYVVASMVRGNAYLRKIKVRNNLRMLYPLDPSCVTPDYTGDRPTFEVRATQYGTVKETLGANQVIHIPGILLEDPYVGVSVVEAHKNGIGTAIATQRFFGRYLSNDAAPGVVLKHPGNPDEVQRNQIRASYEAKHQGAANAGRPGVLWGGWEIDRVAVSLQDAQFIEGQRFTVQDIARMLGVPAGMLDSPEFRDTSTPEQDSMRFVTYGLKPWMDRAEQGLACDMDLFPEPDWSVEFDADRLLRADMHSRWDANRLGRQGGWITPNEIRAREGLPPVEGGDEIQQTPVGGAANPETETPAEDKTQDPSGEAGNG